MKFGCRSWNKYEEEKNHSPRVLDFDTIKERDVLSRTLNEIHKCVLPKEDDYRIFKTPEEIATGKFQFEDGAAIIIEDPRKNPTRILKNSYDLIKDYGYSTELDASEHKTIFDAIDLKIMHNPLLITESNNKQKRFKKLTLTPVLIAKHKIEVTHFNKCAEIFFYRNVGDMNNLVSDDMKKFLMKRWNETEKSKEQNFQVITMLLRDQAGEVDVTLINSEEKNHKKEIFTICDENFPNLGKFSAEDLIFYSSLRKTAQIEQDEDFDYDIEMSLEILAKLFVDTEEFSVSFSNQSKNSGKIFSSFERPLPLKSVSISEALEEIVKTAFHINFHWCNMNKIAKPQKKSSSEFKAELMNSVMQNHYSAYINEAGSNEMKKNWKFAKNSQSFKVFIQYSDVLYSPTQVPANISIKLEYQTKFGAERMTRDELLKEWCQLKFLPDSITLRYRIDAETLKVLSISTINIGKVEHELLNFYSTNPNLLLANLVNIFGCIQRLPEGVYLIQAKLESDCKKLFIHKASDIGKVINGEPWEVSSAFTRKWNLIDESTPSFIHINHNFSPGCFPFNNRRGLVSYIKKPQNKKINKKIVVDPKVEAKKAAVIKKKMKNVAKRKKKMLTLRKQ